MKARCSSCNTVFNIPEEKIAGRTGRIKVRCPRCQNVLTIEPKQDEPAEEPVWYYAVDGAQQGPVTLSELLALAGSGLVNPSTLVWNPTFDSWRSAGEIPELVKALGAQHPAGAEPSRPAEPQESIKPQEADEQASKTEVKPEHSGQPEQSLKLREPEFEQEVSEYPRFAALDSEQDAATIVDHQASDEASSKEDLFEPQLPLEKEKSPAPQEDSADTTRDLLSMAQVTVDTKPEADVGTPALGPASDAASNEWDERDNLFAAFDSAPVKGEKLQHEGDLLYARRETSVLFSLDDLLEKQPEKPQTGTAAMEDSGLIDIRQVIMTTGEEDLFAGFDEAEGTRAPSVQQMSLAMPLLKKRSRWPFYALGSAVGAAAIAVCVVIVMTLATKPSVDIIRETIALASEAAFKQNAQSLLKLQEEQQAALDAKRQEFLEAMKAAEKEKAERIFRAKEASRQKMESLRALHQKEMSDLDQRLKIARKAAEERAKKAAAVGTASDGSKAGGSVVTYRGAKVGSGKAERGSTAAVSASTGTSLHKDKSGKESGLKKERDSKQAEKKKEEKKTIRLAQADSGKAKEKKVKVNEDKKAQEANVEEKKPASKDAKAILAALDKKSTAEEKESNAGTVVKKTLTTTDVMKVVNSNKPAMAKCFAKYGAGLESATIRSKITIASSGKVTAVQISSMEFAGTALGNCVKKVQSSMTFPPFAKGPLTKPISVRLP